ncbi:MAG: hypothetical protein AB1499_08845 [Nitrospirota bacterium]
MSKKNKPLPKPPSTPFGRKRAFEGDENSGPLMADKMAMAMSAGKLDEFLEKELPDNEHARKLVEMMMGMTGMIPSEGLSVKPSSRDRESLPVNETQTLSSAAQMPEDVISAVRSGDAGALMDILKREHKKRQGISDEDVKEPDRAVPSSSDQAVIDKDIIDALIKIASENNTSIDWLFFRALKRYVEEYRKTGNL